jgi:NAD(P)-dependent dehydrogenase (short-subunit alcohol dehydrogenase family)
MQGHALVTGGSRGIGLAIARRLHAEGCHVTLVGRDLARAQAAAQMLGDRAQGLSADVTDRGTVDHALAQARKQFGPVCFLINNAGAAEAAPFARTSAAHWQQMLDSNLTGAFHVTQAALPDLLSSAGARIVNIASTAGLKGYPYVAAYVAAKHGLVGLTRALALEFAGKDITVNAVCPGYTETDLLDGAVQNIVRSTGRPAEEARQTLARSNPQGRLIHPDEIAATVAWLCSPAAGSITGQAIAIAGGEVM